MKTLHGEVASINISEKRGTKKQPVQEVISPT